MTEVVLELLLEEEKFEEEKLTVRVVLVWVEITGVGEDVPFCLLGLTDLGADKIDTVDTVLVCPFFSFSFSWNCEIKFTRLVVSARPAYMVLGRSFLSLR